MESIETFDWERNLNRVSAGMKGGPLFMNPAPPPALEIGADPTPETSVKLHASPIPEPAVTDPWVVRLPAKNA